MNTLMLLIGCIAAAAANAVTNSYTSNELNQYKSIDSLSLSFTSGGGDSGGRLVCEGPVETVRACAESFTGQWLRRA